MERVAIFKLVAKQALQSGFISHANMLRPHLENEEGFSIKLGSNLPVMVSYQVKSRGAYNSESIGLYYVNNLIAYCGGVNLGHIETTIRWHRSKAATLMFITELIYQASCYKGLVYTTNNDGQNGWCNYIRDFVNKSTLTDVTTQRITNANTSNIITCTMFNSYELARLFNAYRYEPYDQKAKVINNYLNELMSVPKEEPKPTPIIDVANNTNNNSAVKSNKTAPVRAPQVRKKYRSQWASTVLNN